MGACLEHCELTVSQLRSVAALAADAASPTAVKPPGLEVLLDLLGALLCMCVCVPGARL